MEQPTSLTERIIALLLARLEQESDPEKAAKWVELLERVAAGQIRRFDEEKQQIANRQSPVADKGR
jgi:hypothetical protein